MRKSLLGVLVIGLLVAAEDKKPDDAKDKLKGTWTVVSMEREGKKAPPEAIMGMSLTMESDKITFKHGDDTKMGTYKIDATQKPGHFDITPSDGDKKTMKMIYQLDGDMLKIGGDKSEDGDRPKNFEAAGVILTLKREKK